MTDFGGRAMCPADEYDDLELREEMAWHALEEALAEMYEPAEITELRFDREQLARHLDAWVPAGIGDTRRYILRGLRGQNLRATLSATSDARVISGGDDATVDLVCTLTYA